jgi:prepilin signal peptidase PulO-like enzyme (type II secretory pathway)
MELLLAVYLFIIGAACGSFALVLADRMHSKRDWVKGRSACEHCKHVLRPIDLIPIVSWLALRGRCRYCRKKVGVSYPLTELFTATVFAFSYLFLPYNLDTSATILLFVCWLFALVLMTALLVYDLRWKLLPTSIIQPLIVLGGVHVLAQYSLYEGSLVRYAASVAASVAVGSGIFGLLWLVSHGRWIGDGDIRFGVVIGLFLADPLLSWLSIFVASILGLVFAFPLLKNVKKKSKAQIPFGPFLIGGLIITYIYGASIIDWYFKNILYL